MMKEMMKETTNTIDRFCKLHGTLLAVVLFFAGALAQAAEAPLSLTFGLYQSDKATIMYRKFSPVLEAIQNGMEPNLGKPVDIHLKIFKDYAEANNALVQGKVDFVRFGPASYIIAKDRNPDIELIVMENKKGKKRFQGFVIVRTESPFKKLSDLKGYRFAFGNKLSTIGRYLVQGDLAQAGVRAEDLKSFDYLGRHDTVFKAVLYGDYEAGSVKDSTFKRYNQKGELRVLHRFDNVSKPWIARAGLDPVVMEAMRASLLTIQDPAVLKELKVTGFFKTSDNEYDFVRKKMRLEKEFHQSR